MFPSLRRLHLTSCRGSDILPLAQAAPDITHLRINEPTSLEALAELCNLSLPASDRYTPRRPVYRGTTSLKDVKEVVLDVTQLDDAPFGKGNRMYEGNHLFDAFQKIDGASREGGPKVMVVPKRASFLGWEDRSGPLRQLSGTTRAYWSRVHCGVSLVVMTVKSYCNKIKIAVLPD